jgi:hypothetical protein
MDTVTPQTPATPLPVTRACDLPVEAPEHRWLIRDLWAREGVGLIGGHPKVCKSWVGLEIAVSLASATPCLGRFQPAARGRALLYMAEDAIPDVRARLESLCHHREVDLAALDVFLITADSLRIDRASDQQRLLATVAAVRPDLLLLDPLVRLHARDENSSADMSALLGFLRRLQREHHSAVILVHHTRKNGSSRQPGQALRGSSDLHAFGDSNLYLSRSRDHLTLTVEHRAAPSPDPLQLVLASSPSPHLEIVDSCNDAASELSSSVVEVLANEQRPLTRSTLRRRLRVKNQRLGAALSQLENTGRITRSPDGWLLAGDHGVPVPPIGVGPGNDLQHHDLHP